MFRKIFDFLGGTFLSSTAKLIDTVVTSKEEKMQLNIELKKLVFEASQKAREIEIEEERELSKRHVADMNSDSWLSKNIRPLTLIVIIAIYSIFAMIDGNIETFNINDNYIDLLGQWGMVVMSFYFGGRSVEKSALILKKDK